MKGNISRGWKVSSLVGAIQTLVLFLLNTSWANAANSENCNFTSSTDHKPLPYKAHKNDTNEAKLFYKTCINPYTEKFAKDANAALAGKKKYFYFSCSQCHGGGGAGTTGPAIDYSGYLKNRSDKQVFEDYVNSTMVNHLEISTNPEGRRIATDNFLQIMAWLRSYRILKKSPLCKSEP